MIRTTPRRRRGRPSGPTPLFLDDCVRLDATDLLAKSRGALFTPDDLTTADRSQFVDAAVDGRAIARSIASSYFARQRLGTVRRSPSVVALSGVRAEVPRLTRDLAGISRRLSGMPRCSLFVGLPDQTSLASLRRAVPRPRPR